MRGQEEGGAGGEWAMQPLSGLHRASDGYLGTVSRGQSGQGSAATAATIVKPEPQALGAGPFAAHGCYSVPGCAQPMAQISKPLNFTRFMPSIFLARPTSVFGAIFGIRTGTCYTTCTQ